MSHPGTVSRKKTGRCVGERGALILRIYQHNASNAILNSNYLLLINDQNVLSKDGILGWLSPLIVTFSGYLVYQFYIQLCIRCKYRIYLETSEYCSKSIYCVNQKRILKTYTFMEVFQLSSESSVQLSPGPEVMKLFSSTPQLSMIFVLLY